MSPPCDVDDEVVVGLFDKPALESSSVFEIEPQFHSDFHTPNRNGLGASLGEAGGLHQQNSRETRCDAVLNTHACTPSARHVRAMRSNHTTTTVPKKPVAAPSRADAAVFEDERPLSIRTA